MGGKRNQFLGWACSCREGAWRHSFHVPVCSWCGAKRPNAMPKASSTASPPPAAQPSPTDGDCTVDIQQLRRHRAQLESMGMSPAVLAQVDKEIAEAQGIRVASMPAGTKLQSLLGQMQHKKDLMDRKASAVQALAEQRDSIMEQLQSAAQELDAAHKAHEEADKQYKEALAAERLSGVGAMLFSQELDLPLLEASTLQVSYATKAAMLEKQIALLADYHAKVNAKAQEELIKAQAQPEEQGAPPAGSGPQPPAEGAPQPGAQSAPQDEDAGMEGPPELDPDTVLQAALEALGKPPKRQKIAGKSSGRSAPYSASSK